jgi:hypothetical protein
MGNAIRLQGHEKFSIRDGWIGKALKNIETSDECEYSDVFLRKDAPDIFGIGNNMVKSLRYWMKAIGLSEEKSGTGVKLTPIGSMVKRYDPYFEDIFSAWIAHFMIATNFEEATTWYLFFNNFDVVDFRKDIVFDSMQRELLGYVDRFSEKSLQNDIDVLLNMYSKDKEIIDPEDKTLSPFAQLGLIRFKESEYTKEHPDKRKINEWIVLFYLMRKYKNGESVSINDLIEGEESISSLFQLTATHINELLDKLDSRGYIRVNRTAGLDVIYIETDMTPEDVMREYYENHR